MAIASDVAPLSSRRAAWVRKDDLAGDFALGDLAGQHAPGRDVALWLVPGEAAEDLPVGIRRDLQPADFYPLDAGSLASASAPTAPDERMA